MISIITDMGEHNYASQYTLIENQTCENILPRIHGIYHIGSAEKNNSILTTIDKHAR